MPAALGERLHARGDVDAVAIDRAVGLFDHIAQIDPDAELHAPVRFEFDVVPFHGLLDLDRGLDRLDRTRELGQQRIAGCVDHAAAVAHHQAGDDVAIGLEGLDGGSLVGRHETGIADHVRAQDRGELASAAWVGHRPLHEGTGGKLTLPGNREQPRLSSSLNSGKPRRGITRLEWVTR